MKPRSIFAGALALALSVSVALAQTNPGSGPLTIAKGGTNAITASAARTSLGVAIGSNVQAWDTDLDCLAANATAGVLARTGAGTCAARTITAPAAGFTITNPAGTAGDPTFVLANDLAALEALASTGFAARTGTDAWAQRTFTAPAAGFTITNPAGVAGNPTFVLANDLAALEGLASTGFAARTTTDTWAQRTVTGTANAICVTNGDGVSGNPTLDICSGFLSTAHSWAGVQTLAAPIFTGITENQGTLKLSAFVTSTQVVANTNNYTATDGSNTCTTKLVLRISTDASRNITGLSCGQAEGDIRIIHNVGAFSVVLTNQDAGSTAGNRFLFGGDMTLLLDTSVTIRYDAVASRWRAITTPGAGGGGGGVTSATIAAGEGVQVSGTCTITTSGTCTVARSDTARQNELLTLIYQSKSFSEYRRLVNLFATGFKGASDALNGINTGSSSNYTVTPGTAGASTGNVAPTVPAVGSRITGATPSSPIFSINAGSAANINDNSTGTVMTVSGTNVSAATVANRLVGMLDLGSIQTVTKIEGKQYFVPAGGTSAGNPGFYYSTDNVSWTQAGSTIAWPGSATDADTGAISVSARYVALVISQQNFTGSNFTIADLNAYGAGTPTNMTLVTTSQTADATVSNGRVLIEYDNTAAPTLNTDLTAEVTCNGGTNWATASLSVVTSGGLAPRKVAESVDQSCGANTGTSFASRIKTLNNKFVPIYGDSLTVH